MLVQIKTWLWALFILVLGANSALIYLAVTSEKGLVTLEPYKEGLNYDERKRKLDEGVASGIDVSVRNSSGSAWLLISGAGEIQQIDWKLMRPGNALLDRAGVVGLLEENPIKLGAELKTGLWLMTLEVKTAAGESFLIERKQHL